MKEALPRQEGVWKIHMRLALGSFAHANTLSGSVPSGVPHMSRPPPKSDNGNLSLQSYAGQTPEARRSERRQRLMAAGLENFWQARIHPGDHARHPVRGAVEQPVFR